MKSRDKACDRKYDTYIEHPRYGKSPRYTASNPNPYDPKVELHWNATNLHEIQKRARIILGKELPFLKGLEEFVPKELPRIAGTAIKADSSKQYQPTVPVTHYYDVERVCRNCKQPFIFFAEEQKYWYETLQFPLHADCIRCPKCRKTERFLARNRAVYEQLSGIKRRDWKDNLQMAGCALTLVEHGVFGSRVIQSIRALIKTAPETERAESVYLGLVTRLKQVGKHN